MKNLFLALIVFSSSSASFADDFTQKGIQLLYSNLNDVKVTGEKNANLQELLQDAAEFYADKLSKAGVAGGDDDDESKLKDVLILCKVLPHPTRQIGKCEISLDYKAGDYVEIFYLLDLKKNQPLRILNNHVRVGRY